MSAAHKRRIRQGYCLLALTILSCLAFGVMAPASAQAATADEIVAAARTAYMSGQDLNSVLSQAWTSVAESGMQPFEIAGLLSSMLLETGVRDKGQDPNGLLCMLPMAFITTLQGRVDTAGLNQDEMYRGFSEAVIGIRTAARALPGVSETMVTKCVTDNVAAYVNKNPEKGALTIIADNAISSPTAEAYSPPAAGTPTGGWMAGVVGQGYGAGGRFGRGGTGGNAGGGSTGKPISPNK